MTVRSCGHRPYEVGLYLCGIPGFRMRVRISHVLLRFLTDSFSKMNSDNDTCEESLVLMHKLEFR